MKCCVVNQALKVVQVLVLNGTQAVGEAVAVDACAKIHPQQGLQKNTIIVQYGSASQLCYGVHRSLCCMNLDTIHLESPGFL